MFRPIEVGDFVLVSREDFSKYYRIISITSNEIKISPLYGPRKISTLVFGPTGKWEIYGTNVDFQIKFVSREQYMNEFRKATMKQLEEEIKSYATIGMEDEGNIPLTNEEIESLIGRVHDKLAEITDELVELFESGSLIPLPGENYILIGSAYREGLSEKEIYQMIDKISAQ